MECFSSEMYLRVHKESMIESVTAIKSVKSESVVTPSDRGGDAICDSCAGFALSEIPTTITFDFDRNSCEDWSMESVDSPSVMTSVIDGTPTRAPYIGLRT